MKNTLTPYRVNVSAQGWRITKRLKRVTRIEPIGYGYQLWTEKQSYCEARLLSAGSFLFPGLHAVRAAALSELSKPHVHQVQVRTNQDKKVYLWNKHADGRVTGYRPA